MGLNAQGSRARDNQRQRLYDAENTAARRCHPDTTPMTMDACREELHEITTSRWWRQRFTRRNYVLLDGRGTRRAFARYDEINLPRWARARGRWVLLHELAHTVTPDQYAWHGPEFAKTYLALVERFIGDAGAKVLREEYARHKVKYRTANVDLAPTIWVAPAPSSQAKVLPPLSASEKLYVAQRLRRGVREGMFGPSGTKTRTAALAVARTMEKS